MRLVGRADATLGRTPMYRVVSIALAALAVVAFVLAWGERLDPTIFDPTAMLLTLVVLVVGCLASAWVMGRIRGLRVHLESSVITGLLLWFLYWPSDDLRVLGLLAAAALLATLTKFVFRWRQRHLFNPAAAGVVVLALIGWCSDQAGQPIEQLPYTTWWVGSQAMLPWVTVAGLIVLWRLRRAAHVIVFVLVAVAATVLALHEQNLAWDESFRFAVESSAIVFFAAFMLTEPLTLAARRRAQLLAAVVAAVVFTAPLTMLAAGYILDLSPVGGSYEIALLAANLVAAAAGQRGADLTVRSSRDLGGQIREVAFSSGRPLPFAAGQYLELDLAGTGAPSDPRGLRRMLSISSPPAPGGAGELTVAVRVPAEPSAFKRALGGLEVGDRVRATSLGGDFVWPGGGAPLLLIAGGIGVTPYLSQVRAEAARDRDVVLVYGCASAEIPYGEELAATGVPVILVAPERSADLPASFTFVEGSAITKEIVEQAVPDHADRTVFISGPPIMVTALQAGFPRARTDHFSGY